MSLAERLNVSHPHSQEALAKKAVKQAIGYTMGGIAATAISALPMILAGASSLPKEEDNTHVDNDNLIDKTIKDTPETREKFNTILKTYKINVTTDSDLYKDLLNKYIAKVNIATSNGQELSDEEIASGLKNYAKGKMYLETKRTWGIVSQSKEGSEQLTNAMNNKKIETKDAQGVKNYATSLHNALDLNSNGGVDFKEYLQEELLNLYLATSKPDENGNLPDKQTLVEKAQNKAEEIYQQLIDSYETTISNIGDIDNDELKQGYLALAKFKLMDKDGNMQISVSEAQRWLLAKATCLDEEGEDTTNDFTFEEDYKFDQAVITHLENPGAISGVLENVGKKFGL